MVTITIADYEGSYTGTAGNNFIVGTSEEDIISMLGGNDVVLASNGGDQINGGTGIDIYDASSRSVAMVFNMTTGVLTATGLTESVVAFENFGGGAGNDQVTGTTAANALTGNGGDDQLYGMAGNDSLVGSAGPTSLMAAQTTIPRTTQIQLQA